MKKIIVFLFSITFFFHTTLQAYSSNPADFITELVNEAITKLADKNLNKNEKSKFVEKIALDNVDIAALGLYTLGQLRKSSDEQTIFKYQEVFEKY